MVKPKEEKGETAGSDEPGEIDETGDDLPDFDWGPVTPGDFPLSPPPSSKVKININANAKETDKASKNVTGKSKSVSTEHHNKGKSKKSSKNKKKKSSGKSKKSKKSKKKKSSNLAIASVPDLNTIMDSPSKLKTVNESNEDNDEEKFIVPAHLSSSHHQQRHIVKLSASMLIGVGSTSSPERRLSTADSSVVTEMSETGWSDADDSSSDSQEDY